MNNTLSKSFDDLQIYKNEFIKKYNLSIIEINKLKKANIQIQIFENEISFVTDWIEMEAIQNIFISYPDYPNTTTPNYTIGVQSILSNYSINLNNISNELIKSINTKILIQSGDDGKGPSRPLSSPNINFLSNFSGIQILSEDTNESSISVVCSKFISVSSIAPSSVNYKYFPDGFGPLTPYYSKLILKLSNSIKFL